MILPHSEGEGTTWKSPCGPFSRQIMSVLPGCVTWGRKTSRLEERSSWYLSVVPGEAIDFGPGEEFVRLTFLRFAASVHHDAVKWAHGRTRCSGEALAQRFESKEVIR